MLKIWLPFSVDKRNIGLSEQCRDFSVTNLSIKAGEGDGLYGKTCGFGYGLYHMDEDEYDNDFTIATWVKKKTAWSKTNTIISCKNISASNVYQWYMSIFSADTSGGLRFNINNKAISASYNFSLNTWYHVAGTYNGTTKQYAIYVNGSVISTGTCTNAKTANCNNIGVNCRSTVESGTGYTGDSVYLNDYRVYSHALMDWEIKKLYNCGAIEAESNMHLEAKANLVPAGNYTTNTGSTWGCMHTVSTVEEAVGPVPFLTNNKVEMTKLSTGSGGGCGLTRATHIPISPNGVYTYSTFVKPGDNFAYTHPNFLYRREYNSSSSQVLEAGINDPSKREYMGDGWYRIWNTFTANSATTKVTVQFFSYPNKTITYYIGGAMLEEGDKKSPYTSSNREEALPCINDANNGLVPYNIIQSGDTMYFNGVDAAIKIPLHEKISGGTFSINIWFYRPTGEYGTKAWETLVGGPSGFELSSMSSSTKAVGICPYSWGGGFFPYETDKWNMVTMTRNTTNSKFYLNGELLKTGSKASIPQGDYFIGSWKTNTNQNFRGYMRRFSVYQKELTQEDILNLYLHNE